MKTKLRNSGLEMVNIVCKITKVQRTDNWLFHLEAISECLPYFAGTEHYLPSQRTYFSNP